MEIIYPPHGFRVTNLDEAKSVYKDALKVFRSIPGAKLDQARCTMNLGNVYLETDRFQEAENAFG